MATNKIYNKNFEILGEIRLDAAVRKNRAARSTPAAKIRRNAM